MQISQVAWATCSNTAPCIYFIFAESCVYIGESLHNPLVRWGSHLSPAGTFTKRLNEFDSELAQKPGELRFLAYSCLDKIYSVNRAEWKYLLRYVEHRIHELVICHRYLGARFDIISDTSRTAAIVRKYVWLEELAEQIVDQCVTDLSQ